MLYMLELKHNQTKVKPIKPENFEEDKISIATHIMNDPNIYHNMIKVHVKYSSFINYKITQASDKHLWL